MKPTNIAIWFIITMVFPVYLLITNWRHTSSDEYDKMENDCQRVYELYRKGRMADFMKNDSLIDAMDDYYYSFGGIVPGTGFCRESATASFMLGIVYKEKKQYTDALESLRHAALRTDSTDTQWGAELMARIRENQVATYKKLLNDIDNDSVDTVIKANFIRKLDTEHYEDLAEASAISIVLLSIAWIIIGITIAYYVWKWYRNRRETELSFMENIAELETSKRELELLCNDKDEYFRSMIEAKEEEISALNATIESYSKSDRLKALAKSEATLMEGDIVVRFRQLAKDVRQHPSPNDWHLLHEHIESCVPSFYVQLSRHSDLREDEKNICSLVRLHFLPSEISILLGLSRQAISTCRQRLLFKIFGETDKGAREFDRRIMLIK